MHTTEALTLNAPVKVTLEQIADLIIIFSENPSFGGWGVLEVAYRPSQEDLGDKSKYGRHAGIPCAMVGHRNFKVRVRTDYGVKVLNLGDLKKGLEVMAQEEPDHFIDLLRGCFDYITADAFLQCSFFGKRIFS